MRNYGRLQEACRDGSQRATAWLAATVGERTGRRATVRQAATVAGGRRERQERRRRKRRRGRPQSAKDGQMHQVPKGVATNGRQSYGACVRRTEASCYVRDKRRETKQLYALAAVGAKRTQQSPRAYPQRPRRWRTNMIQPKPHLSRARANAVIDLTGFHGLTGFGSESSQPPTGLHRTAKSCPKAAP